MCSLNPVLLVAVLANMVLICFLRLNCLLLLFKINTRCVLSTAGQRRGHGLHCGGGGEYFRALQQPDKNSDGEGPRQIH